MTQLHYKNFIKGIETQYPEVKWDNVQQDINTMFHQAFQSASIADPPMGFGKTFQARAMYGIDLMLGEGFKPKLLGMNCFCANQQKSTLDQTRTVHAFMIQIIMIMFSLFSS